MTVSSHPGDETLLRHAAGTLPAGPRLVVDIHLSGCPHCRAALRRFEAVGGVVLEEMAPGALLSGALAPDALDLVLARLGAPDAPAPVAARAKPPGSRFPGSKPPGSRRPLPAGLVLPPGVGLPVPLAARRIGPLRPVAPGVRIGRVHLEDDPSANVLLFRIGPGRSIPVHTHAGTEFTHVISGGFSDPLGHYGPGDLVEADGEVEHTPMADVDGECISVAAFDGRLRFRGLLGVALRPFI